MSNNIALIKINSISGEKYYTYAQYEGKPTSVEALKNIELIDYPTIFVTKEYRGSLIKTVSDIDNGNCIKFYTGTTESYEVLNVMRYETYLGIKNRIK